MLEEVFALWAGTLTFAENANDCSVSEVLIFLCPANELLSVGQRSQGVAVAFDHSIGMNRSLLAACLGVDSQSLQQSNIMTLNQGLVDSQGWVECS